MKSRRASRNALWLMMAVCFSLAGLLILIGVADLTLAPKVSEQAAQAAGGSFRYEAGAIADQILVFVMPLTVIFLIYFAFQINRLIKSLGATVICSHENPECGFSKKYFRS